MTIPFVRDLDVHYGRVEQVSPLIRRVVVGAGQHLGVEGGDPSGCAQQPLAARVFAQRVQQLADDALDALDVDGAGLLVVGDQVDHGSTMPGEGRDPAARRG